MLLYHNLVVGKIPYKNYFFLVLNIKEVQILIVQVYFASFDIK